MPNNRSVRVVFIVQMYFFALLACISRANKNDQCPFQSVKTTKALQSKKGKAALAQLHPHSRRAKQICRVFLFLLLLFFFENR